MPPCNSSHAPAGFKSPKDGWKREQILGVLFFLRQNQIKKTLTHRPLTEPFNTHSSKKGKKKRKIRAGERSNVKKHTHKGKSCRNRQPLCTSQWLSLKFVSLLIFSQLDATLFRAPVRSDLTSETERGPFASPQTVKVPQESNATACCHDQRSAGKPDGDADAHNCHLKEGGKFSLQRLFFGVCGQDTLFFLFFVASIRIRGENGDVTKHLKTGGKFLSRKLSDKERTL